MIKVNGIQVTVGHFPDNSLLFKYNTPARIHEITWLYENDEEQVIQINLSLKMSDIRKFVTTKIWRC